MKLDILEFGFFPASFKDGFFCLISSHIFHHVQAEALNPKDT